MPPSATSPARKLAPPTISDSQFESELKVFERQVGEAAQFLFAQMAINHVARRNSRTLRALNVTPVFWNTVSGALQYAAVVAVGRVFGHDSKHNVDRVLRLADQNRQLFSKAALADRKRRGSGNADEWLPGYLTNVHEPTTDDFRRLRGHVKRYRAVYESQLKDIRNKHFAHTEVIDAGDVSAMFARAQTPDFERLVTFLNQLHDALWQLFHNGRAPRLRPMPRSSRSLVRRRLDDPRERTAQEYIVTNVKRSLRLLTKGNQAARSRPRRVRTRRGSRSD